MWEILDKFKRIILSVDPQAYRYFARGNGNQTVWSESTLNPSRFGDDDFAEYCWQVTVERYTQDENDPVVISLMQELDTNEIAYRYSVRRIIDQEIVVHVWECEVV